MLKNILNLEGTQKLSTAEQKAIKGGITDYCNFAILDGYCVKKNGTQPCPANFPINDGGGCCCSGEL